MNSDLFVTALGSILAILLVIAFRTLPKEKWQILAAVPLSKTADGNWYGLNLTFYGLFVSLAEMFGISTATFLLASAGVPSGLSASLTFVVLVFSVPASRWVARIVDRKRYNFTVSGAVAVGMATVPLVTASVNSLGYSVSTAVVFAAVAIGYTLAEGLGRLACISFGCCYGKPLDSVSRFIRKLFSRVHFTFSGKTKKIAYESGLDGVPVVPIQAVTSCVHLVTGLIAMLLFLRGFIIPAFLFSALVSYGWRICSETLRADHRGEGRMSKYQILSAVGIACTLGIASLLHEPTIRPNISLGFAALWNPFLIVFYQLVWWALFLYHGLSKVTGSEISIHIEADNIAN